MRRLALLLVLTGCPPAQVSSVPQGPTVGCPTGNEVYTASFVRAEPGRGRTGWVLPLHDVKVDDVTGKPEYQRIDAAAANAAGVADAPKSIWLMQPGGPPCKAKVVGYYAAAIPAPGSPNISYGAELDGCKAPPDDQEGEAIALASEQSPAQCRVEGPKPIAQRIGEMTPQKTWKPPAKETAIPPGLATAIPEHDCKSPDCETLWLVFQVDVDNVPAAWTAVVNWLHVGDAQKPCEWPSDTFSGFFVPSPVDGKAIKIEEGQDHPLQLAAILADGGGPKILLAAGPGEYTTYDLVGGKPKLARHSVWLIDDPKAYAPEDKIGPSCEPEKP